MAQSTPSKTQEHKHLSETEAADQALAYRHVTSGPHADILALQHVAGNQAINQLLQPNDDNSLRATTGVPTIVEEVLKSGSGQPLDPVTRDFMESRFGHDFGNVRVHTDLHAAESAEAMNAQAYTVGQDVVVGKGRYEPKTMAGKRLLAHELAHVVQQLSVASAVSPKLSVGSVNSPAEAAAERASNSIQQSVHIRSETAGQLAVEAGVSGPQVQRQPASSAPSTPIAELKRDIERIKDELDSPIYTEGVEEAVIGILRNWAGRGTLASGYLDWIFDGLQVTKSGVFGDTTYYDAMLDNFDRADEIRQLRDGTRRYRGRESAKETRRRAEEAAERRETDIAADIAGRWTENVAEPYDIPPTPENLAIANLAVRRLSLIPSDKLLPIERAASELVSEQGPEGLLRKYHWVTESERKERLKAQIRAIARPFVEILLWEMGFRVAGFLVEAIAARLFAVEAEAATALTVAESEAVMGSVARTEGRFASSEGPLIVRDGFTFQVKSFNPITGEATAVGTDLAAGEVIHVQINIDTGAGFATRASGETLPIRGGRIVTTGTEGVPISGVQVQPSPKRLLPASTVSSTGASPAKLLPPPRAPRGLLPPGETGFISEGQFVPFQGEGPMIELAPIAPGETVKALEVGAGPTSTFLGIPDEPVVSLLRTDINETFPIDRVLDATGTLPPDLVEAFDVVIINNPRGYIPNLQQLARAVRGRGRIIIQGNRINEDFIRLVNNERTPPGFSKTVDFDPRRDLRPDIRGDPEAIRQNIMGGPFSRTQGDRPVFPNMRIIFSRER